MAAGTVTITEERLYNIHKVTFAWTSGTGAEEGTATGTTAFPYTGLLLRAVTVPDGTDVPTDDYDLTLTDKADVDVAIGKLINRDDTNTEWITSGMGAVTGDKLTLNVENAGAAKKGVLVVYIGITPETDVADVVLDKLAMVGANMVSTSVTHDGSASYTAFTVTGLVAVKVVGYVTTALSNEAATTSVGTATSAAGLIAATAGTAMQTVGQAWVDNAPSKFETFPANWALIGNGEDIVVDGDASLAAGVVSLYCWWVPISAGASVVAA